MSRPKRSCDYSFSTTCHRLATVRVLARKTRGDRREHESQYCDEHAEIARGIVPPDWRIVSTREIEV